MRIHKVVLLMALIGCSAPPAPPVPITTFSGICEAISNPPQPGQRVSKARFFAPRAIRADFVPFYDSLVVAAISRELMGDPDPSDPVVEELVRLRMIGVWGEGTTLHLANSLLFFEGDDDQRGFDDWMEGFRILLDLENPPQMSPGQKCIYGTMNAFFEVLVLHGPGGREDSLPLAYYLESHEQYNVEQR